MDEGGEPACWLDRVCDECGRLRERSGPGPCEHCGSGAPAVGVPAADGGRAEDGRSPQGDHPR
ncbi:hypothetical protein ABT093_03135 [Kitasatospora sp. NPDC002551]|uniref:hypothetical protein n=1 Tax=Kitasatospora sp. NPDC002551 TaxID=3154539 RepID=UPI003316A9FF